MTGFRATHQRDLSPRAERAVKLAIMRAKAGGRDGSGSWTSSTRTTSLAPGEIAERRGRSESSIHGLEHRARQALVQELERLGSAPAVSARRN